MRSGSDLFGPSTRGSARGSSSVYLRATQGRGTPLSASGLGVVSTFGLYPTSSSSSMPLIRHFRCIFFGKATGGTAALGKPSCRPTSSTLSNCIDATFSNTEVRHRAMSLSSVSQRSPRRSRSRK